MFRTILMTALITLISGCGLIPRTGTTSLALQIADAMSIPADDVPRAKYDEAMAANHRNLDNAASGVTQLLASGDPTMLLLSGLTPGSTASRIQIAAWVPEEVASSPDEAVAISSQAYIKARADVYAKDENERQKLLSTKVKFVLGQPFGEGGIVQTYAQIFDVFVGHSPSLVNAPSFMRTPGKVYGPIFLDGWSAPESADQIELITQMSKALPAWFYIYSPGLARIEPRAILNQGQKQLFVKP